MTAVGHVGGATHARFDHVRELDALRGLAVAAVVAYHLWPEVLPGGFIGVDIFFVLSGFLLSALLVREVERSGRVDAGAFLIRRVRRLLPALLLVLGAITVYAATVAGAVELDRLRRHTWGSLTYTINWMFIADGTTYTDIVAGASPLRHVWSLAIEEQFYLVLAVTVAMLVLVVREDRVRTHLAIGALVLATVSAVAMIGLSVNGASLARTYFGTDTRAQAMLIGVALGAWRGDELMTARVSSVRRRPQVIWLVGASALLTIVAFVGAEDATWMHRGGFTAVAIATAIVIAVVLSGAAGRPRLLRLAPLLLLGTISYGVYLWHWPVLVILDEERIGVGGFGLAVIRVGVTLALATASFVLVERPVRRGAIGRFAGSAALLAAPVASVAVAAAITMATTVPPALGADANRPAPSSSTPEPVPASIPLPPTVTTTKPAGAGSAASPSSSAVATASTTIAPVEVGPIRMAVLGDSVAHTLIGGQLDGRLAAIPWTEDRTSFPTDQVEVVPITRPVCSFLAGEVALDGGEPIDLSSFCAGWDDDLVAAMNSGDPIDVTLVLVTNDLENRSLDGRLVEVSSPEWELLMVSWLDEVRSRAVDDDSVLVLAATPPRLNPAWSDGPGVREARLRELYTRFAEAHDGVETIDLGRFVEGRDLRYDGLHYTQAGAIELAAWLTPQLRQLASSSGTGTSG